MYVQRHKYTKMYTNTRCTPFSLHMKYHTKYQRVLRKAIIIFGLLHSPLLVQRQVTEWCVILTVPIISAVFRWSAVVTRFSVPHLNAAAGTSVPHIRCPVSGGGGGVMDGWTDQSVPLPPLLSPCPHPHPQSPHRGLPEHSSYSRSLDDDTERPEATTDSLGS